MRMPWPTPARNSYISLRRRGLSPKRDSDNASTSSFWIAKGSPTSWLAASSPQSDAQAYESAFRNVRRSVRLND